MIPNARQFKTPYPETAREACENFVAGAPSRAFWEPRLVKGRKSRWTKRNYWVLVRPEDARYETAPFEMHMVFHDPKRGTYTIPKP